MIMKVRLLDIANEVGVSRVLVGKILLGGKKGNTCFSDATAEKVRLAAAKLGYTPNHIARQLRGVSSRTIGVIMPVVDNTIMFSRLNAFVLQASEKGYSVIVRHMPNSEKGFLEVLQDLASRQVEGFLFLDYIPTLFTDVMEYLKKINISVMLYGDGNDNELFASHFQIDLVSGVEQVVNHLVSQNYSKIALFLTNRSEVSMLQRLAGYKKGVIANGLKFDESLVWSAGVHENLPDDNIAWHQGIKAGAEQLLEKRGADAVIMSNDIWALNMMKHIKTMGIFTTDKVGIVGFDNISASFLCSPELTSVDQRVSTLAEQLMEFFLNPDVFRSKNRKIMIKPELIVRESTIRNN